MTEPKSMLRPATAPHPYVPDPDPLMEALRRIVRTPAMPFPDPGAHSLSADYEAVTRAYFEVQRIAKEAIAAHLQQRPLTGREATDERNWKLAVDGVAGNFGSRWAGPDEMGWSFEQSAFYDFCAALASPSLPVREEPTGRVRLLTTDEMANCLVPSKERTLADDFLDVQRKFCEVNGLVLAASPSTDKEGAAPKDGAPEVDRSEQGRTSSAVLGNNVQAFVDSGLSFPKALETALKVYDHPPEPHGVMASDAPSMVEQIRGSTEYVSWFPIQPTVRPCDQPGGCNARNCLGCGETSYGVRVLDGGQQ